VTNETDSVCLEIDIYDADNDVVTGEVTWSLNANVITTISIDECFIPGDHQLEFVVGDELSVEVTISDSIDFVTEFYVVLVEEEPE